MSAATAEDPIHVLNPEERAGLQRVARGAVLRAVFAGVLNAIATGLVDVYASQRFGPHTALPEWHERAPYWLVFGTGAVVFAVIEVAYLGWDGLRSVTRLSAVAGLQLDREDGEEIALALARAALELPNPPEPVMGVNPHREASRLHLVFASAAYKLKISVTNFIFKQVVAGVLPRIASRYLLAFTAIPINGLWNGLVCWAVLREARIRVMGPSAAVEMLSVVLPDGRAPSPELAAALHRAVASCVVRTRELHPNHIAMLRALRERIGDPAPGLELDRSDLFLRSLPSLSLAERRAVLRVLAVAAILDGRLVRPERRLLAQAYDVAEVPSGLRQVRKLRRAFVSGDVISPEELRAVAS
ncbi:MAG: hypothetical protein EOO73_34950 [Myxococcales bacterium]|nr:MAG: hypothetical protein EOO73_34950 [Myxococcales bacterium]